MLAHEDEDAGRDRHVEPGLVPHDRHQLEDPPERALVGAADGQHDAELRGAERRGLPGGLQDLVDGDGVATRELGVQVATELVGELLEFGVPGVHLYAMNRAESIQAIYKNLGLGTN